MGEIWDCHDKSVYSSLTSLCCIMILPVYLIAQYRNSDVHTVYLYSPGRSLAKQNVTMYRWWIIARQMTCKNQKEQRKTMNKSKREKTGFNETWDQVLSVPFKKPLRCLLK